MPSSSPQPVRTTTALSPDEVAGVRALAAAAEAVDGGEPLAEDARLALEGRGPSSAAVTHLLVEEPDAGGTVLAGYAQVRTSGGGSTVELLVAPERRGAGLGGALVDAVRVVTGAPGATAGQGAGEHGVGESTVDAWSHGDHPGAARLAERHDLRRSRVLLRMERSAPAADLPPTRLPEGVALRAFEPGRDDAAWLALNAAAFADHPEQGGWDEADLAARLDEPWFDARGLLLLVRAPAGEGEAAGTGRLLASHWTKVADPGSGVGEVYVVAVAPDQQGRGLGTAVVLAGLHHLADRGAVRVELYVEGDNAAALRTYEKLGFVRVAADVSYSGRW